MTTPSLYEIEQDMLALDSLLDEVDGEVTDEQVAESIEKWFAENEENLLKKLDGYGAVIKNNEGLAKMRKAEGKRLTAMGAANENLVKRLKERLKIFFENQKLPKQETARFKFWTQKNGQSSLVFTAEVLEDPIGVLPKKYIKHVPEVDNELIRETLANGTDEEKAELAKYATLVQGTHMRVS